VATIQIRLLWGVFIDKQQFVVKDWDLMVTEAAVGGRNLYFGPSQGLFPKKGRGFVLFFDIGRAKPGVISDVWRVTCGGKPRNAA
jgi:hypothetical protein